MCCGFLHFLYIIKDVRLLEGENLEFYDILAHDTTKDSMETYFLVKGL